MKYSLIMFALFMTSITLMAQDGNATTVKKTFSRTTSGANVIEASQELIWEILTDASSYAQWNSTVIEIQGKIEKGEKIYLKSTLDPDRTFKLKINEMDAPKQLIWGDMMGKRKFTLDSNRLGTTFTMTEKIGGLMFPLFANKIPSFDESFTQFAADLKKEAERRSRGK